MTTQCATCPRPVPGQEYGCAHCARVTADRLAAIAELAPAARDVAARQTRRGPAVGGSGGGSRLPLNLAAAARLDSAQTAVTTWARHVIEERGGNGPESHGERRTGADGGTPLGAAARWLTGHVEWFRHRQEWSELYADVAAAERVLRGVVDGPPDRQIVGACECETTLYARPGASVVRCRECQATWDVEASREILLKHVADRLLTAAEIAGLAVVQDPERDRLKVRKLINVWTNRGQLTPAGITTDGDPTYRVGPVLERLADARPRAREAVA